MVDVGQSLSEYSDTCNSASDDWQGEEKDKLKKQQKREASWTRRRDRARVAVGKSEKEDEAETADEQGDERLIRCIGEGSRKRQAKDE